MPERTGAILQHKTHPSEIPIFSALPAAPAATAPRLGLRLEPLFEHLRHGMPGLTMTVQKHLDRLFLVMLGRQAQRPVKKDRTALPGRYPLDPIRLAYKCFRIIC